MKKFIVLAAIFIAISSASFAQTKPTKQPRKSNAEKLKEKEEAERQLKEMEQENEEKEDPETKKTPAKKTTNKRPVKDREDVTGPRSMIVSTYYELPINSIPQVKNYIEEKEDVDSKSLRRGFIRDHLANRNFLHLQLPADDKFTRIQQFITEDKKNVVAIQTSDCKQGTCNNTLRFYSPDSSEEWVDVTEQFMPELDKKYILNKIKSKYKKEYLDLDLYNSKGYETDEEFYNRSLVATIDGEQNKIIIREQYLPLPLYEMVWDGKSKFILKKL